MRRLAIAAVLLTLVSGAAQAQAGCSWTSDAFEGMDRQTYWQNPRMHNEPYDGRLMLARIWYSGLFAFCAANQPYSNESNPGWAHDFPHPEENLALILKNFTLVRSPTVGANIFNLDDSTLFKFPFAYLTEPGGWYPSAKEVVGLRNYLLKGGFLLVDDWRGPDATLNALAALKAVFPALTPIRIPDDHPIFDSFYHIENPTSLLRNQNPGYGEAEFLGFFQDNDPTKRLLVVCDVNEDIKDYWIYYWTGRDPVDISNQAFKLGVNFVVYEMTH